MERVGTQGVDTLEEAQHLLLAGLTCPAPQTSSRRVGAARNRASTSSRTTRAGSSTSASPRNLRARVRSYFTASETRTRMGEDGPVGRARAFGRLPHRARGRGPRAATDRRAQAALQPSLPLSRAGPLGQAHGRAVPRLSLVRELRDDQAGYLGPFGSRRAAKSRRWLRATRRCRSASAPTG